jgi:ribosomal protein L32
MSNCPGCGRFARATTRCYYDGTWDQIAITTHCAKCGELEQECV